MRAMPAASLTGLVDQGDEYGLDCLHEDHVGWTIEGKRHYPDSRLVFHTSSGRTHNLEFQNYRFHFTARSSHFDYYPPGEFACTSGPQPGSTITIRVPRRFEHYVLAEMGKAPPSAPRLQFYDRRLARVLYAVCEFDDDSPLQLMTTVVAVALVERIHADRPHDDSGAGLLSDPLRRLLREFMEQNLGSKVSAEQVGKLVGLTASQANLAFHQSLGCSVHEYLLERRIALSKDLLRTTTQSVVTIALDLGFASHAHFSTVFQRFTDMSPSAYRRARRTDDC